MSVIDITNFCNLRCVYCCRGEYDHSKIYEPTLEDISNVVQQLIENRGTFIVLQGGEPMIRKDIADVINNIGLLKEERDTNFLQDLREIVTNTYSFKVFNQKYKKLLIKQSLPMLYITTNGMFFSHKIEESLIKNGFSVDISLDSTEKELNEMIRKGINFDLVEKNIYRFSKRLAVNISCTVTEYNVDSIDKMVPFTRDHRCISLKLSPVIMVGKRHTNDDAFRDKYINQLNNILDSFESYQKDIFLNIKLYPHYLQTEQGKEIYNRIQNTPNIVLELHECAACKLFKEIYIDTNLDVYGCASMKGNKNLSIGNLRSTRLKDIWMDSKRKDLLNHLEFSKKYLQDYSGCVGAAFSDINSKSVKEGEFL